MRQINKRIRTYTLAAAAAIGLAMLAGCEKKTETVDVAAIPCDTKIDMSTKDLATRKAFAAKCMHDTSHYSSELHPQKWGADNFAPSSK